MNLETWELLSYVVTVIGLPLAISVFIYEQHKERKNEEELVYESISDNYQEFLRVVLEHPDLHLFSMAKTPALTEEQHERMTVIFSMLISLFERAYIMLYDEGVHIEKQRRWSSWHDRDGRVLADRRRLRRARRRTGSPQAMTCTAQKPPLSNRPVLSASYRRFSTGGCAISQGRSRSRSSGPNR